MEKSVKTLTQTENQDKEKQLQKTSLCLIHAQYNMLQLYDGRTFPCN